MTLDTPKTTLFLQLESTDSPLESTRDIGELLQGLQGKFKLLDLRINSSDKANDVFSETKEIKSTAELHELFNKIGQFQKTNKYSTESYRTLPSMIPHVNEKIILQALPLLSERNARLLLEHCSGVTKKVLLKAMTIYAQPRSIWAGSASYIQTAIQNHPLSDDEVVWIALKSELRSVQARAITKASVEMIKYVEDNAEDNPLPASTLKLIAARRKVLNKST